LKAVEMRLHPFIVVAVVALVAVTAWSASSILGRGRDRERRVATPPPEPDEAPPAPRPMALARPASPAAPPMQEAPGPTGVLRVRVIGPHGLLVRDAEVSAVRQGHEDDDDEVAVSFEEPSDDEAAPPGTFVASELPPGRYDVSVTAPGLRDARVAGVPTGGETVTIALPRAPILRGAIGTASPTEGCRGGRLAVRGPEDEEGAVEPVDVRLEDDCSFVLDELPAEGPFTVELYRGADPRPKARVLVTLPGDADPAFVCLLPPCAEPPASVAVFVADAEGRRVDEASIEWTLVGDGTFGEEGTIMGDGFKVLHDRRVGETLRIAASDDEQSAASTLVVGPGVNDVVLTLSRRPRPRP
jgi:hypothetical protein